jgi:hypothetical protein
MYVCTFIGVYFAAKGLIINEFSKRKGKKNTINIVHENTISQFKVSMILKNSW